MPWPLPSHWLLVWRHCRILPLHWLRQVLLPRKTVRRRRHSLTIPPRTNVRTHARQNELDVPTHTLTSVLPSHQFGPLPTGCVTAQCRKQCHCESTCYCQCQATPPPSLPLTILPSASAALRNTRKLGPDNS